MTLDMLTQGINAWVSQYLAAVCLLTLTAAVAGRWYYFRRWDTTTRDFVLCLTSIAMLTLLLATVPRGNGSVLWPPITWFAFTMLLVMELLWIVFVIEQMCIGLRRLPSWFGRKLQPAPPPPTTTSATRELPPIPELRSLRGR